MDLRKAGGEATNIPSNREERGRLVVGKGTHRGGEGGGGGRWSWVKKGGGVGGEKHEPVEKGGGHMAGNTSRAKQRPGAGGRGGEESGVEGAAK